MIHAKIYLSNVGKPDRALVLSAKYPLLSEILFHHKIGGGSSQSGICPLFSGVSVSVSITLVQRSFINSLHGIIASTPTVGFESLTRNNSALVT